MDLTDFKNWLLNNCSSPESAETHYQKMKSYFLHKEEFNTATINAFLGEKREVWANSTSNIYINAFKWYAKYLKVEIEFPKLKAVNVEEKASITEKEFQDILIKLPLIFSKHQKIYALLSVMWDTGMRPKNVITLKREDFDFENKNVMIKKTKTYTDKNAPLSNKTCNLVLDYFNQEAEGDNAFNVSEQTLERIFAKINITMQLKEKISPYSMRRSFALNLEAKGIDTSTIQRGMGHKNVLTTLGYLKKSEKTANDTIRESLNKKKKK